MKLSKRPTILVDKWFDSTPSMNETVRGQWLTVDHGIAVTLFLVLLSQKLQCDLIQVESRQQQKENNKNETVFFSRFFGAQSRIWFETIHSIHLSWP